MEIKDKENYHMALQGDGLHIFKCPRTENLNDFIALKLYGGKPVAMSCNWYRDDKKVCSFGLQECIFRSMENIGLRDLDR
jgi:hypothetical protein